MIWCVIFVVLMIFWLVGGFWPIESRPQAVTLGNALIPWACVAILGMIQFGAITVRPLN